MIFNLMRKKSHTNRTVIAAMETGTTTKIAATQKKKKNHNKMKRKKTNQKALDPSIFGQNREWEKWGGMERERGQGKRLGLSIFAFICLVMLQT